MSQPVLDLMQIILIVGAVLVGWMIGDAIRYTWARRKQAAPRLKQSLSRFSMPVKKSRDE